MGATEFSLRMKLCRAHSHTFASQSFMGKFTHRLVRDFSTECRQRTQTHKLLVSRTNQITVRNKAGFKTCGAKPVYIFCWGKGGFFPCG
jgi:hypothetical protein